MSKLAVTPVNKPTGLMRRHPSIRAPDRSPFGSISEGVKVQLHYLPPAAFIVDHSPPAFHRGNSVGEPDREGAKITPFPDEESLQTFEDARIAVQDDDPFGGGHRQLSKNIVPNASSPVASKRSDFFGSRESIRPQLSNGHLQGHRHSSASGPCGPQLLQQASRSASIEKMPPPSDIIQQKGERLYLSNNSHVNQQPANQAHSGVPRICQSGRGVSQAQLQIIGPTSTFADDHPRLVAESSPYMSRDPVILDQPSDITASQQRGKGHNLHYDKHFQTPSTNRHQVETNINRADHRESSNTVGTHGHVHRRETSRDDEFVARCSFQALIFDDDSSMIGFDGTEQTLKRTPDKRRAVDNESESIFNFTPRAQGQPDLGFNDHLTIIKGVDSQAILFKRMKIAQVFDHVGKWTDPKEILEGQINQFERIKQRWEGFFGRLEDLVQTKDAVLQHKQDLTKQYADAGEQLAEQCDEIQLATRHTHKKRRVCRA
ncbi:hypothetical protein LQV05_003465 [Cryptococcus neoformans]|nr:hypothetical protein LQV05_003465 [Cryptococcus neoformans]